MPLISTDLCVSGSARSITHVECAHARARHFRDLGGLSGISRDPEAV
ncbi:MAG TPA: hypothetical protein VH661_05570 [Candidatus Dormibacteraeota bacterium]|jgi:hypothetical protein|nr:hypothetical protein [Candidatus Dormibacteraeota bacterium]